DGSCPAAAWSPDGKWMYFTSDASGAFQIWRQRCPDGAPEQVTTGVTEEAGLAIAPNGRSFVTSVGIEERTIWVHDGKGERQISSEGYAAAPFVSSDGTRLYYRRGRHRASDLEQTGELWVSDLYTGHAERLLPGFSVLDYSISPDSKKVAFEIRGNDGKSQLWLASLDGQLS